MKKILLLIVAPFVFFFALSAQVTQEQADGIVLERLSQETQPTVYAQKSVQTDMTITTSAGETLELDYACWVYYYTNAGRYLIVNASNGNLLEVNAKSNAEPSDLAEWREVKEEINYPILLSKFIVAC